MELLVLIRWPKIHWKASNFTIRIRIMEKELIDVLKNMQLTEEEELQISVLEEGRAQVIEECSQSLIGKLLTDRKQNLRALKNTLRIAWKTG